MIKNPIPMYGLGVRCPASFLSLMEDIRFASDVPNFVLFPWVLVVMVQ